MKSTTDFKRRAWCFTMFTENEVQRIRQLNNYKAICIGREVCPTTGKEHFQGYIRFNDPIKFSWWKNQFPKAHVEQRKGTEEQASAYCRKENNVIVDEGCKIDDPPTIKNPRTNQTDVVNHVLDMLEAGAPLWQIYQRHRVFYFHNRRKIQDLRDDMTDWDATAYSDYRQHK